VFVWWTRFWCGSWVERGASLAAIAEEVRADPSTVRKWLRRWGLETKHQRTLREAAEDREQGLTQTIRTCALHGMTVFRIDSRDSYRCVRCNSERVMARRRRIKEILLAERGGACALCGYRDCVRALEFHHMDPAQKLFGIGFRGVTRSLERARAEAAKCVLLCANCHAEVEAGVTELP
jgi:DNA-directed RNA polymerase subunit RPC12/RpoP